MHYSNIMVDIETMAAQPNAAIASIGACKFTWDGKIIDKFYINVDVADCKRLGLIVSKSTIDWWMQQPKSARDALKVDPRPLKEAVLALKDWAGSNNHHWWCNGANFDYPILEEGFVRCEVEKPWKHWNLNDYRTVMNLFNINNQTLRMSEEAETYHNALDDAIWQTKKLVELIGEHKRGSAN